MSKRFSVLICARIYAPTSCSGLFGMVGARGMRILGTEQRALQAPNCPMPQFILQRVLHAKRGLSLLYRNLVIVLKQCRLRLASEGSISSAKK